MFPTDAHALGRFGGRRSDERTHRGNERDIPARHPVGMAGRHGVRFSKHATHVRMPKRNITAGDVLATMLNPAYTFPGNQPGTLESYGTTADGRAFYVVSTNNRKFVITVVELEEL